MSCLLDRAGGEREFPAPRRIEAATGFYEAAIADLAQSNSSVEKRGPYSWFVVAPQPPQLPRAQQTMLSVQGEATESWSWAWIRARVQNATSTYYSYSGEPGGGLQQRGNEPYEERERLYEKLADGTIQWMAFKQKSLSTLKGKEESLANNGHGCGRRF